VLEGFGVRDEAPVPLPGGQGTAWRAGGVVFKPLDGSLDALRWQAGVLAAVRPDGIRLAAPLPATDGRLVVEGWTAWPALAGRHEPRWAQIADAGERLHRALEGVPRPDAILDARTDRWAVADRVAWGETGPGGAEAVPAVVRLLALRAPVPGPSQLVHGDLSGNVLFAPGLPPAVIDFSPYWRPAPYASAVVAVDAVLWHAAPASLLARVGAHALSPQLVVRALLFRLLAEEDAGTAAPGFERAISHVERRLSRH